MAYLNYRTLVKRFYSLFQLDTRLLNYKQPKKVSKKILERIGNILKTCFSAPQNAKNEHQTKHKNQVGNLRFLGCWVLVYERLYLSLGGEHIKVKGYLNFILKNVKIQIFRINF